MAANTQVSVIVPTFGRQKLFPLIYDCFLNQTIKTAELLIHDDSPERSSFFDGLPGVRYFHSRERLSIGRKRNFLIEQASSEVIAHFDDDDYYAPRYLATMLGHLQDCDFVNIGGWFAFCVSERAFGYWDTTQQPLVHFLFQTNKPVGLVRSLGVQDAYMRGYGFKYLYRKSIWKACRFPDRNHGEDYEWVKKLPETVRMKTIIDDVGLVLHIIHTSNSSRCFPTHHLPIRLLGRFFGDEVQRYIET
ncbi:MAG: glycosyltransferase family 2 protein [Rhodobacteraceae bacterium]|nr:MAG: glycosyltransferase family 2 protein [Paracoccaceae bacterium]